MYTLSDARLEWLGEGILFKLDSSKCWRAKMQPIFKSFPGPLLKSGMGPWPDMVTTYMGNVDRCIFHLTQD